MRFESRFVTVAQQNPPLVVRDITPQQSGGAGDSSYLTEESFEQSLDERGESNEHGETIWIVKLDPLTQRPSFIPRPET